MLYRHLNGVLKPNKLKDNAVFPATLSDLIHWCQYMKLRGPEHRSMDTIHTKWVHVIGLSEFYLYDAIYLGRKILGESSSYFVL